VQHPTLQFINQQTKNTMKTNKINVITSGDTYRDNVVVDLSQTIEEIKTTEINENHTEQIEFYLNKNGKIISKRYNPFMKSIFVTIEYKDIQHVAIYSCFNMRQAINFAKRYAREKKLQLMINYTLIKK
jgi:uncharacterized protein YqfB (UPF0267 family)